MKLRCQTSFPNGEGGFKHRFSIAKVSVRYHSKRRQWVALGRELWQLFARGHYGEMCQECGRRYCWTVWHAPDWLWMELVGKYSGLLCPRCFNEKARARGYVLYWQPDVEIRNEDGSLTKVSAPLPQPEREN